MPETLIGDQIRLKQILINLMKIALKSTINGDIKIIAAYDVSNELLLIQVKDSGAGLNEEKRR